MFYCCYCCLLFKITGSSQNRWLLYAWRAVKYILNSGVNLRIASLLDMQEKINVSNPLLYCLEFKACLCCIQTVKLPLSSLFPSRKCVLAFLSEYAHNLWKQYLTGKGVDVFDVWMYISNVRNVCLHKSSKHDTKAKEAFQDIVNNHSLWVSHRYY